MSSHETIFKNVNCTFPGYIMNVEYTVKNTHLFFNKMLCHSKFYQIFIIYCLSIVDNFFKFRFHKLGKGFFCSEFSQLFWWLRKIFPEIQWK